MLEASGRHARTWAAICRSPTPPDLRWADVLALVRALGAECEEREGSRLCVALRDRKLVLHRPHPGSHLRRAAVRDVRDFLLSAGVAPP